MVCETSQYIERARPPPSKLQIDGQNKQQPDPPLFSSNNIIYGQSYSNAMALELIRDIT